MSDSCFTILYGSQTGQAKAIAEEIYEQAEELELKGKILCLSTTDKQVFMSFKVLSFFITSTSA